MKLTDRDIKIINFLEAGATIQQIADLFFNGAYDTARKRLKLLQDNKYIKGKLHPTIGKKTYYKNKLPSYHKLVLQDLYIANKDVIKDFKREVKLGNHVVDGLIILQNDKIVIVEVDIYNKTKRDKINEVKKFINQRLHCVPDVVILDKEYMNKEPRAKRLMSGTREGAKLHKSLTNK